jgi:hypothetical protein
MAAEVPVRPNYKKLFGDAAWKFASFIVPFLCDTAICSVIFIVLLYFVWLLRLGRAFGLRQEQSDAIELLHFWLGYGVYAAVGISFLWRVLLGIFRNGK